MNQTRQSNTRRDEELFSMENLIEQVAGIKGISLTEENITYTYTHTYTYTMCMYVYVRLVSGFFVYIYKGDRSRRTKKKEKRPLKLGEEDDLRTI